MSKEKDKKETFLGKFILMFFAGFFIIFSLIVLIAIYFFGFQPSSSRSWFFENYYNQTHDQRYQWTQQK